MGLWKAPDTAEYEAPAVELLLNKLQKVYETAGIFTYYHHLLFEIEQAEEQVRKLKVKLLQKDAERKLKLQEISLW